MSPSHLALKSVGKLLVDRFFIASYQRGYRWSPTQVRQLLEDVWEFIGTPHAGQFYCLQPLVVKPRPLDGSYEVVDGQQRLTTLRIILACLKPVAPLLVNTLFDLTFETRGGGGALPLDPVDPNRKMENIDYYHLCQAHLEVRKWCAEHSSAQQLKLLQHLIQDDDTGRNVRVIWFELGERDKAVEAFTRLNVGKIRLTNDELIRALFLGRGREAKASGDGAQNSSAAREAQATDEALKTRIAYEWDVIEKALQSDDFWAFLTEEELEHNRIGFLFKLLADDIPPEEMDEEYKVFLSFNRKLAAPGGSPESEWRRVKQEFMRLREWFEDERRVTFHLIGFLVTQGVRLETIRELSKDCTKTAFDRRLRDRVYQSVVGPDKVPAKETLVARLTGYLAGLRHPAHRPKIHAVLLLFNLATLLENPLSNVRFQFDAFKRTEGGWDLEHIRSRATDRIADESAWLAECLSILATQADSEAAARAGEIRDFLAPAAEPKTEEQFAALRSALLAYFQEDDDEERNDLGNLVLLDGPTNRSYKNATFGVKRKRILSLDRAGTFVPLCTRNVFLKAYSRDQGKPIFWTDADGEDYQQTILQTLIRFFLGPENRSQ